MAVASAAVVVVVPVPVPVPVPSSKYMDICSSAGAECDLDSGRGTSGERTAANVW